MLYLLLYPMADEFNVLNLFRYITFRTGGAILTAMVLSFVIGQPLIDWLRAKQGRGQPIRDDGPEGHLTKRGTPTMGGFLILLGIGIGTLLWADLTNRYIWVVLLVTFGFGLIGFYDDYLKVTKQNPKGVPGKLKLVLQVVIAGIAAVWINQIAAAPLNTRMCCSISAGS
jgi:phospho-N-acetylmuramoyl-pentapeptide-transferase